MSLCDTYRSQYVFGPHETVSAKTKTHRLRSHAPSLTKSNIRPGVPTTIVVTNVFPSLFLASPFLPAKARFWGSLSTPPYTATLAKPKGAPSSVSVSCVWSASSRVGAMTRTDMGREAGFDFDFDFDLEPFEGASAPTMRAMAGRPNARVLPLFCKTFI